MEAARVISRRLRNTIDPVAVFVNPTHDEVAAVLELFPVARLQLAGGEPPEVVMRYGARAIKVVHVDDKLDVAAACDQYGDTAIAFDTKLDGIAGGTGAGFRWSRVIDVAKSRPVIVAGGLTADNVAACVRMIRPWGVDVRGGIESNGHKNPERMRAFVRAVREADAS